MAKKTLLEITQDILSDIDGDEVNSIDDTIESARVASIVRSTYESLMSHRNWPHNRKLITVEDSGSEAIPTDRKRVVSGQRVSVSVEHGGLWIIKTTKRTHRLIYQ